MRRKPLRSRRIIRFWRRPPRWVLIVIAAGIALTWILGIVAAQGFLIRQDLLLAKEELLNARTAALDGHFDIASEQTRAALKRTLSANGRANNPLVRMLQPVPFFGTQIRGMQTVSASSVWVAHAANDLLIGASKAPLLADRSSIGGTGFDLAPILEKIRPALPGLKSASAQLATAKTLLDKAPKGLVGPLARARDELSDQVASIQHEVSAGLGLISDGEALVGRPLKLLLLSQDPWELRPSGGFIGSYGILELNGGRLRLLRYDDATALPPPARAAKPPEPFASSLTHPWTLTGAGWWPNFPESARAAEGLFVSQGGEPVDGVLAITPSFLEDILRALGPMTVPGYPDVITADNAQERILYHVELKHPHDTPRKKFLILLTQRVFDEVRRLPAAKANAIIQAFGRAFHARDAQIYLNDAALAQPLALAGWDGAMNIPEPGEDYLAIADANFGTDKANRWVKKTIDYHVFLDAGHPVADVTITTSDFGAPSKLNPAYNSYLRVFAPAGSAWSGARVDTVATTVGTESGFATFGRDQLVAPGASVTRRFRYRLPGAMVAGERYRLTVHPQAGTPKDEFTVRIDLAGHHLEKHFVARDGDQVVSVSTARPNVLLRFWRAWRGALRG